ncbi:protein of unknown function [Nakamurella panacisegetis]|uniref:DnaJ homologue subfamily C member 28 conserved domain-containing protein n=1 Tax=Nakamurella panacisegetis TaxID=1090615 RepID=A0A1H0M8T2_9ACTN|nr:DUF1992 domain-containing protein [Nakamurella panacisegetis]SDO76530.1 protein of unknown function [Nakamurella panacisegetis]
MSSIDRIVERQILAAQEKGLFDDLPGAGKPLRDLGGPRDENWWLRQYMMREGIDGVAFLPPALALRREAEDLLSRIPAMATETSVRQAVAELNVRIGDALAKPAGEGPSMTLMQLDADQIVIGWRAARTPQRPEPAERPPDPRRRRRLTHLTRWIRVRDHRA